MNGKDWFMFMLGALVINAVYGVLPILQKFYP